MSPAVQIEALRLESFIDKYTPEVAAITRACLGKMRRRLPGAVQLIYDNYNCPIPTVSFKARGMSCAASA
jgi:hypothetical protein